MRRARITGADLADAINSRRSRDYLRALPFKKRKPFDQLYPNASPAAHDFLARSLTFDPRSTLALMN